MESKKYVICRVNAEMPLDCRPWAGRWGAVKRVHVSRFPWYSKGEKQMTHAAVCYSKEALFLSFECEDRYIYAADRSTNGAVCKDSCVEFFATVPGDDSYFNLEINCCGVIHLGYGPRQFGRELCDPAVVERIEVATTVESNGNEETFEDEGWILQVRLPFDVLAHMAGRAVEPSPGEQWRGNFYRCGGRTNAQHACWAHINTPAPDFHRPEFFGQLVFGGAMVSDSEETEKR